MNVTNPVAPHFIVLPLTGVQIYRRMPLVHLSPAEREEAWKSAKSRSSQSQPPNALLGLIRDYIACDQSLDSTDWFACSSTDAVFFRLIRIGHEPAVDLVIDTHDGAGRMIHNLIHCVFERGRLFSRSAIMSRVFMWNIPRNLAMFRAAS